MYSADVQVHDELLFEVPQGWFQRHNISPGTLIRTQFGDLKTSFSFRPAP